MCTDRLGHAYAEAALTETDRFHYESLCLALLHSQIQPFVTWAEAWQAIPGVSASSAGREREQLLHCSPLISVMDQCPLILCEYIHVESFLLYLLSGRKADQIRYVSCQTFTSSYCQNQINHHDTEAALHPYSQPPVHNNLQRVKDQHKTSMKNKYESLFEGVRLQENQTLLNRIYTQLYIIEGESEGVNEEHEVLLIEKSYRTLQDTPINCNDIFNPLPEPGYEEKRREQKDKIKTVLTKGIAGIGKTVSVQKFILDWAEGKANQDVDFMFVLPFREMNLIKDHQYSFHRLLLDFHPELQDLDTNICDKCKVVFIFDGLDESRISLMFSDSQKVSDVNETSSVGVLMSNLLRGDLLPSALIWITTRPAAANQIPSNYINRVTEIQGFNDPQKEEYFRQRISASINRESSHTSEEQEGLQHQCATYSSFCWISSTVLQNHPETRSQLMKGNVMFYEEDLRESGIDVTDASVYSGICTEIFREESVIYHWKVYSFVHLSFQEFFAALYVFYCYLHKNSEILKMFLTGKPRTQCENVPLEVFLKEAVNEALKSKNGHLDLFLRFLHGVSLESNQRLLQDVLIYTENNPETIKKIIQNLKRGQKNNVSPERLTSCNLTDQHCEIVASALQSSNSPLRELDLSKNDLQDSGVKQLCAGFKSPNCQLNILR
ncbi:hypothetical protein cypCar_00041708, partial [Cyprinus carpio]